MDCGAANTSNEGRHLALSAFDSKLFDSKLHRDLARHGLELGHSGERPVSYPLCREADLPEEGLAHHLLYIHDGTSPSSTAISKAAFRIAHVQSSVQLSAGMLEVLRSHLRNLQADGKCCLLVINCQSQGTGVAVTSTDLVLNNRCVTLWPGCPLVLLLCLPVACHATCLRATPPDSWAHMPLDYFQHLRVNGVVCLQVFFSDLLYVGSYIAAFGGAFQLNADLSTGRLHGGRARLDLVAHVITGKQPGEALPAAQLSLSPSNRTAHHVAFSSEALTKSQETLGAEQQINQDQHDALKELRDGLSIVHGPPGTGGLASPLHIRVANTCNASLHDCKAS
jgi:hypothetical protein